MKFKTHLWSILFVLLFHLSCAKKEEVKAVDTDELIAQVKRQVNAFHSADTTLNSEGVLDLLWPEFTMLSDGKYINFEHVSEGAKSFMASLESFHTKWDSLRIIPLGDKHAISSFIFTDSIVAKDGTLTQSRGPNTFIWEQRNGIWKVIYGDADHYSIDKTNQ